MHNPPFVLVDNNVFIDFFIVDHPRHLQAKAFMEAVQSSGAEMLYGASKIETMFYIITQEAKRIARVKTGTLSEGDALAARAYAWGCVQCVGEMATAVGLDGSDLWLAQKYRMYHPDLEDNILLAAAERSNADYLVTWDEALLRDAAAVVRAVTPTVACKILRG